MKYKIELEYEPQPYFHEGWYGSKGAREYLESYIKLGIESGAFKIVKVREIREG